MKRVLVLFIMTIVLFVLTLEGVVPKKWEIRSKDDFLKGKFNGVSLSYEGVLSLSPKEERVEGPAEEFYLSLLLTPEEVMFLGTGHGGKIYRIRKKSKPELYFQVPEMDIYCLVRDRKGNLYAGTSPNGKIYKITGKNEGDVFFNPREKYIWDLMFTQKGILLAAVGESGGIYAVNKEGEGRLILRAEENHILCIKEDENGDLIAGTGGKGLLYRIPSGKKASILFESPYEEIKSIAFDDDGNVIAAAGGTVVRPKKEEKTPVSVQTKPEVSITVTPSLAPPKEAPPLSQKQPGALYRVNQEGMAKKLWESDQELIYCLLWDERERKLIFGTGNKGRIYSVSKDEKISLISQKNSEQVYYLFPLQSKIYMLSNNPSNLGILFPDQVSSGEYMSWVLDTKTISSWGRIEWVAEIPSGCILQFQTRSGNSSRPNETWSTWSPPYQKKEGERVLSPKARYIQFKVMLKTQSGKISPLLKKISLFYLQTNIAPVITKLIMLPANRVYLKPPEQTEVIWGADVDFSERRKDKDQTKALIVPKKAERKGFQTVTWEAADENGDDLLFSIFIKGESESQWRLLKEKWKETIYAFDTFSFPDGVYSLKVVAVDNPSNPRGMELKSEKISRPLIIDNSLPEIKDFKIVRDKNRLTITFSAEDSLSYIKEVKYLIRPNEWRSIFPVDGICDSKKENFKISVVLRPNFDNLITVKVKDSHGNIGAFRQTF